MDKRECHCLIKTNKNYHSGEETQNTMKRQKDPVELNLTHIY